MKLKLALIVVLAIAAFRVTLWHDVKGKWLPTILSTTTPVELTAAPQDSLYSVIHHTIFAKSCAVSGCHDGSFEPDYRTVQSSYNTLVYHPIIKNDSTFSFKYRVVPYDTAASILFERITNCCFVNNGDRMPFADPTGLEPAQIDLIKNWIMAGAPNPYGELPEMPKLGLQIDGKPKYFYSINDSLQALEQNNADGDYFPELKAAKLHINIPVNASIEGDALKDATVSIYYDSYYDKLVASSDVHVDGNLLMSSFDYRSIPTGTTIYVRLDVPKLNILYPTDNMYVYLRFNWSFQIGPKNQ